MTGVFAWLAGMLSAPIGTVGSWNITFGTVGAAWIAWLVVRWFIFRLIGYIQNLSWWEGSARREGFNSARERQAYERLMGGHGRGE